ncbi:MAG: YegS/Rv2252/BmrU family lipid kinase [Chloroflexota bacterium]
MTIKTAVLVNPHAGNGRAGQSLDDIRQHSSTHFPGSEVIVTQQVEDIAPAITTALENGTRRFLAVGGDGTNNTFINTLVPHLATHPDIEYGNVPMGSGRDFARMLGTPFEMEACFRWLAQRQAQPIDMGVLRYDDTEHYFVNTSSIGLSYGVNENVKQANGYYPWTFAVATLKAAFEMDEPDVTLKVNGETKYSGKVFLAVMSNGSTFGGGMKIAPHADLNDELLEVVIVEYAPVVQVLSALAAVYRGNHLNHPKLRYFQAQQVDLTANKPLGCETDGESWMAGQSVQVSIAPHKIRYIM